MAKAPNNSGFLLCACDRLTVRDPNSANVREVTLSRSELCDGLVHATGTVVPGNGREMTMKKLLIAATICLMAGTNFASAANAASAHRAHRSGASMQSMMSKVMGSGMLSSVSGMIPGGIPGADGGGLGQSPASIGALPSSSGSYGTPSF